MTLIFSLFSIFSYITTVLSLDLNPLSDEFIDIINSKQTLWKAGRNFDSNTPISELQTLLGVEEQPTDDVDKIYYDVDVAAIPDTFDAREYWSECDSIKRIYDQSNCGSSWAISVASAMSDRICIQTRGSANTLISATNIMTCCTECGDGCDGGWPLMAWIYWYRHGIVTGGAYNTTEGCQNYPFPECNHFGASGTKPPCGNYTIVANCTETCDEGTNLSYKDSIVRGEYAYMLPQSEKTIQEDILQYGPLVANFMVYDDFFSYKSGVYYHVVGETVGKQAVRILGWGVEDDFKYWLVANSWNTDWGDNGTFKILRGLNECGIEEEVSGGTPAL